MSVPNQYVAEGHLSRRIGAKACGSTVFRNGANVATYSAGTKTDNQVIEMMIGREYSHIFPPKPPARGKAQTPLFEVRNLNWGDRLRDISFTADAGEIEKTRNRDDVGARGLGAAVPRPGRAASARRSR